MQEKRIKSAGEFVPRQKLEQDINRMHELTMMRVTVRAEIWSLLKSIGLVPPDAPVPPRPEGETIDELGKALRAAGLSQFIPPKE